jgi:hypothetical protein
MDRSCCIASALGQDSHTEVYTEWNPKNRFALETAEAM